MYLLMSTNFLKQQACEKQEKQKNPTINDLKIFQSKILLMGISTKSAEVPGGRGTLEISGWDVLLGPWNP